MKIEIERIESTSGGRYEARIEGQDAAGELTYRKGAGDAVIADHTGVPRELRGHGIATRLVERLVADARAEGFGIVPACPFVRKLFDQHPEWADLLRSG